MKFEVAYFRTDEVRDPSRVAGRGHLQTLRRRRAHSPTGISHFPGLHFSLPVRKADACIFRSIFTPRSAFGDYFNLSESSMMNLENILRDPRYTDTVFVMIHGGYPLEREAILLAAVKNVYMDSSFMESYVSV